MPQNNESRTSPVPLTAEILQKEAEQRVDLIQEEFLKGFEFLTKHPASVTVFGSARFKEDNTYYQMARDLSRRIVEECGFSILTGGGPGIMEAANRGASEAGGDSLGLGIDLPHEQKINPYVTESMEFHYFFSRKVCLSFSAEAFLFFPGGFGTLDELFEIITLIQTHKVDPVPVFLVGESYWNPLDTFLKDELVKRETIHDEDRNIYRISNDLDMITKALKDEATVVPGVRPSSIHNGDN